jgi:hypothetical protein
MSLMLATPPIDLDSPVAPAAVFDPAITKPGATAFYRVTFNALEESIEWPAHLAAPPQLELQPGARGQILALSGMKLQPRASFNYRVRVSELGRFTIPEFKVKVYEQMVTVPAAQIEVVAVPPPAVPPPLRLNLELPQTNLYVGQSVRALIRLPPAADGQLLIPNQQPPVQITGSGLVLDYGSLHQSRDLRPRGPALAYEVNLTPIAVGNLSAYAQSFVGNRFAGPVLISGPGAVHLPGGPPQFTLLESDPISLKVRPLPREGRLAGFTGAVGFFGLDAPSLSTNRLRVGEVVKLTVKVRGDADANLARLVPPPPPKVRDWQVLAAPAENLPAQVIQIQGCVTFNYTLVPLTEQVRSTPAIPFSCFAPDRGTYVDLTIPPVPVTVNPGAAGGDLKALLQAHALAVEPEPEPVLSGLAGSPGLAVASLVPFQRQFWFPIVELAPVAALFGLWSADRRRRYLEQHPDLVLRRRARRALHRERRALARAGRAADAVRFAACAVSAMRVACAPHYPAEPRALVGSDVLALLPEPDRSARPGEVVRRCFALFDASRFAVEAADVSTLLSLQPDLERVLSQLEARL